MARPSYAYTPTATAAPYVNNSYSKYIIILRDLNKLSAPYEPTSVSYQPYVSNYTQPQTLQTPLQTSEAPTYEPFDVDKYLASLGITTSLPAPKSAGI